VKIQNFGNGYAVAWLRLLPHKTNNGSDNGTTLALGNINEDGRKSFFA
jgi:hypothetical protein